MARERLVYNRLGVLSDRKVSKRNLTANYKVIGYTKGRKVFAKKGFDAEPKPSRGHKVKFLVGFQQRLVPKESKKVIKQEKAEGNLVKVTCLVGVKYEPREAGNVYFHAEMLFTWYGLDFPSDLDLIVPAESVLVDRLSDLDRVNWSLISMLEPDRRVKGVIEKVSYAGTRYNEMDFELYIPNSESRKYDSGTISLRLQ